MFDCIHVGAAVDRIPMSLVARLRVGGAMLLPVHKPSSVEQDLLLVEKTQSVAPLLASLALAPDQDARSLDPTPFVTCKSIMACVYSPLTSHPMPLDPEEALVDVVDDTRVLALQDALEESQGLLDAAAEQLRLWQSAFKEERHRRPTLEEVKDTEEYRSFGRLKFAHDRLVRRHQRFLKENQERAQQQ